ncbi:MAG: hypothetical protein AB7G35_08030 [Hyphomicrobiaceae bacterium]
MTSDMIPRDVYDRLKAREPDRVWKMVDALEKCLERCRTSPAPEGWSWTGSHRTPPLAHYRREPEKGRCRVCWKQEGMTKRSTWHPECVTAYHFFVSPDTYLLAAIQDFICPGCGEAIGIARRMRTGEWDMRLYGGPMGVMPEADHVKPLYRVRREFRAMEWYDLLWFWTPANLQALCRECHARKCGQEARERANFKASGGYPTSLLDLMEAAE